VYGLIYLFYQILVPECFAGKLHSNSHDDKIRRYSGMDAGIVRHGWYWEISLA